MNSPVFLLLLSPQILTGQWERGGHGCPSDWSSHTGAGQDVGRSCILVSIAGKNVMLDCGMHMGFSDDVSLKGGRPGIQPAPRRHHRGTWASESQALTMEEERGQVGTGRRAAPTVTQQVEHLHGSDCTGARAWLWGLSSQVLAQQPDFCPTCSGVLSSRWPQWACRVWVSGSTAP